MFEVRFLHSFPFYILCFLKGLPVCHPHLPVWSYTLSWRVEYLQKLFGILLHRRFRYYPPFITIPHLFITQSFHFIHMKLWFLILCFGYNLALLYFIAQIIPVLAIESSFSGSCLPLTYPLRVCMCVCVNCFWNTFSFF